MGWFWQEWKPEISGVISSGKLYRKLRKICPEAQVICMDREYQIPADPADVIWRCSPRYFVYQKESRDCDDSVRIARGWLSSKNFGDLLVMDCVINPHGPGPNHALLAFLDGDKIVFGEPQTGKMRTFENVEIIRLIA